MVMVSVCIQTYNHASFIAQALDSALMQETDFQYEIILGEDESQDGTREICIDYANRHPDRIRLFLRSRKDVIYINGRPSGRFNLVENLKAARGKYIAMLEGDDYWTDPHKLQRQVEFLEAHPECSMCFHAVRVIEDRPDGSTYIRYPTSRKNAYSLEDWLASPIPHTASLMLRQGMFELPDWFYHLSNGDWALNILYARHGQAGYIDEVMSVYRMHGRGIWTQQSRIQQLQQVLKFREDIAPHLNLNAKEQAVMAEAAALDLLELAIECYVAGLRGDAQSGLIHVLSLDSVDPVMQKARVLEKAWEVEAKRDYSTSEEMLGWLSSVAPTRSDWDCLMRDVRSEWYAAHVFVASNANDAAAVRRFAHAALRNDWRVFKNRGLRSVSIRATMGDRFWAFGRRVVRAFQFADPGQSVHE